MQSNATPTLNTPTLNVTGNEPYRKGGDGTARGAPIGNEPYRKGGDGTARGAPIDLTESDEEEQEQGAFHGYSGEEDSYDEFEAYRSDPEDAEEQADAEEPADAEEQADTEEESADAEEAARGARPVVTMRSMTLPVVTSYALDLPKVKRARTQFDREVDAIYHRISGDLRK